MEPMVYPLRLNRYLALQGFATRRSADELIVSGRVMVNGKRAVVGMRLVATDRVEVHMPSPKQPFRYIAYYKPRGIITHSPKESEQSIAELIPDSSLFPLGRLDKDSEGLILLTDDGRVTERLLHPRFAHEKEYIVDLQEKLSSALLPKLLAGVIHDGETLTARKATILGPKMLSITLTEGKKHEIRRLLGVLHCTVTRLRRVRILNISLGSLRPGEGRILQGKELKVFLQTLDLKKNV